MAKTFYVPGNGTTTNQSSTPPVNNTSNAGQTPSCPSPAAKYFGLTKQQWIDLAISSILPSLLYWGLFTVLSSHGINFFFSNLVGCLLALILLGYLKSALKSKTDLATPVQIIMIFILILTMSLHYLPGYNPKLTEDKHPATAWTPGREVLQFSDMEQLITDHTFSAGKEVMIRVVGTSVNLLSAEGSQELIPEYGVYVFRFNSEARLTITGNGGPATVTIRW